jgi:hypothetical protein
MTNYNERLDEILHGITGSKNLRPHRSILAKSRDEAKQAITSLIKELVAEAKPDTSGFSDEYWRVNGSKVILMFEANLLKALEDK